jgi:hypothetical protein
MELTDTSKKKHKWAVGYIKKCPTFLAIREMQIKTTSSVQITLLGMAIIWNTKIISAGEGMRKRNHSPLVRIVK